MSYTTHPDDTISAQDAIDSESYPEQDKKAISAVLDCMEASELIKTASANKRYSLILYSVDWPGETLPGEPGSKDARKEADFHFKIAINPKKGKVHAILRVPSAGLAGSEASETDVQALYNYTVYGDGCTEMLSSMATAYDRLTKDTSVKTFGVTVPLGASRK